MQKFHLVAAISFFLVFTKTNAQTGIGTAAPNASAMLDVTSPNKGMLIPRLSLSSSTDAVTVPVPATYLMVMNTNTALPNGTGLYVNMGTPAAPNWLKIGAAASAANAWLLRGNTGSKDSTNFIGTIDSMPFNVRVNNEKSGRIDKTLENTFWGYQAGNSNTAGVNNTATGFQALFSNTTGNYNTATGYQALYLSNQAGRLDFPNYNTASGYKALFSNTTGSFNTATGITALYSNTYGLYNTAHGGDALYLNTTGDNNTAVGLGALSKNIDGNNNTALGEHADVNTGDLNNTTALGNGAKVYSSNTVQIGNSDVRDVFFGNPAVTKLNANSLVTPSDARFKYNINPNVPGLDFIKKLIPVTYYFDEQKLSEYTRTGIINSSVSAQNSIIKPASYNGEKKLHTGFLAQDVEKIARELGYSFDGVHTPANDKDHYGLAYSQFIMPLVKSVQQQQSMIDGLQKQNEELMKRLEKLELHALK